MSLTTVQLKCSPSILRDTQVERVGQLKSLHFFLVVPLPGFHVIFKFATQSSNSVLLFQAAFLAVAISLVTSDTSRLAPPSTPNAICQSAS
jgi:hypothetical protein